MNASSHRIRADGAPYGAPLVSVVMANRDGAPFVEDAIASVLRQTLSSLEILAIDDGSVDDSIARLERAAAGEPRIRLLRTSGGVGPAAARNLGLDAARGTWIAILDSDDLMHPRRLASLVASAEDRHLDIVADNQIVFDHAGLGPARPLLAPRSLRAGDRIDPTRFIASNGLFGRAMPLGYLKPLIRRDFLEASGCRYDPTLRIAEDYDLIARLLLAGARYRVLPQLTYFYRRHSGSISHRLSDATLIPMLAADDRLRADAARGPEGIAPPVRAALDRRRATIERAIEFETLVSALKRRDWRAALALARRSPRTAALLRIPVVDRLRARLRPDARRAARLPARPAPDTPTRPRVTLLSRQRITGANNGSSVYLLGLCEEIRAAGYAVDLISPSPAMFGRMPYLRLDPAMDLFDTIRIRGAVRFGSLVVARDPRIACQAAAGLVARLLRRIGVSTPGLDREAPHAIAVPLTDADRLFVAGAVRPSRLLLADYAFLNETIPYARQPRCPSAVVMHDLFSAQEHARAKVPVDAAGEADLLDQADAVIAIQEDEAAAVRRWLPGKKVILAPMAVRPVAEPSPGPDGIVVFIGSDTLPNRDGINWFLSEVWPRVIARTPSARLRIAGTCCRGLSGGAHPNVERLGLVDDLDAVYRDAGVVISPLRLGSGLKIKLIEAIGRGKAVIATETTLQGVDGLLGDAVARADDPASFLARLDRLLFDADARRALGTAALAVAETHFSPRSCYRGVLDLLGEPAPPSGGTAGPTPPAPAVAPAAAAAVIPVSNAEKVFPK